MFMGMAALVHPPHRLGQHLPRHVCLPRVAIGGKNAPNDAGGFSSSAIPVRLANYYFRTHQPIQGPDDTDGVLSDDEEGAEGDDGTTIA